MSSLILSVSPETVERPYYFYMTKIKVYSLEELYYHCYHYWKESIDDFLMGKLEDWIRIELKLSHIAGQIAKIKDGYRSITDQYIHFLGLIDYFYEEELDHLRKELFKWENKAEWEKCKEKADYFMAHNKPEEAMKWYKKAIVFDENAKLYNNMGVACMHMGWYEDATYFFTKANEKDPKSVSILLNLTEVCILRKEYEKAIEYLGQAEEIEDSKDIWLTYGDLYSNLDREKEAIQAYKKAVQKGDHFSSYIRLARFYRRKRKFEVAEEFLEMVPSSLRSEVYWLEYAALYEGWNKKDLTLSCILKAVDDNEKSVLGWVALARFYRKEKKLEKALDAVQQAMKVNEEDEGAKLELARIQKEQGNQKDYQFSIKGLIKKWIHRYRQDSV